MASRPGGSRRVAERYASALYELAQQKNCLDTVMASLDSLSAILDESLDLRRVLQSPVLMKKQVAGALDEIARKGGCDDITRQFLSLLVKEGRASVLGEVICSFRGLVAAGRGEVTAHVKVAAALGPDQESALESALMKELGNDKVSLKTEVDPSILGGMVVRIGSRMFDSSLRTKLNRLHFAMKGVG